MQCNNKKMENFESESIQAQRDRKKYLRPGWLEALRLKIARNRVLEIVYRVAVLVVGLAILLAGLAMLILPGPGWAAIVLGLLVLATEFVWAEVLLEPLQRFLQWLARRAKDPRARAQNIVFVALVLVSLALGLWWYLNRYGLTLEPLPFFN